MTTKHNLHCVHLLKEGVDTSAFVAVGLADMRVPGRHIPPEGIGCLLMYELR